MRENDATTVIRRLYQITNHYGMGYDIQVYQLLILGLEVFDLDIAILSRIEGDTYRVEHTVAPEGFALQAGDEFSFDHTFCEVTCGSNKPVLVHDIANDQQFSDHPAYIKFQLGAYIGIPLYLNDELYGTLNFSGIVPRQHPFRTDDGELLKLMALWVEGELLRHYQQQQLIALNEKLEYQARNDLLTGLLNRRGLFEQLEKEISQLIKSGGEGTLVVMDLDHFKAINDTYGHQQGDLVLKSVAQAIDRVVDDKGLVGRFGGEEFILWLSGSNEELRSEVLIEVTRAISTITLEEKPVTTSAGACHFNLEPGQPIEALQLADTLISKADTALYKAKRDGRNRVIHCHQGFAAMSL